jgi:hypothetical protein
VFDGHRVKSSPPHAARRTGSRLTSHEAEIWAGTAEAILGRLVGDRQFKAEDLVEAKDQLLTLTRHQQRHIAGSRTRLDICDRYTLAVC